MSEALSFSDIDIGSAVRQKMSEYGTTVAWLARKVGCDSGTPAGIYYYTFGLSRENNFGLNFSTYQLKPFESLVVANSIQGAFRSSLGAGEVTALPLINLSNDKVVAIEYYNLMGVKVAQPVRGNIYLVKTIFESGKTKVVKQFIENN